MEIELHSHSHYSKGAKLPVEAIPSPKEVVREVKRKGLDAVALTDHNVISGWKEAKAEAKKLGIMFIPGMEINSREGHVVGLGITEAVPRGLSIEETVERIRDQGGISVATHPFDIKGDGLREHFRKCDAVEIFNSLNMDRFSNFLIRRKIGSFPAVVGSDAHTLSMIGNSVNIVDADSVDGALKEIIKGRVQHRVSYTKIAEVRDWSHQRFIASRDFAIEYVNMNYSPLKKWVSLRILNKFMRNKGGFFTPLSHFAIGCTYGYSLGRAIHSL